MSINKPKTLLSFVFNTTGVSAYRDEMHSDLRTSFERFEIRDGNVQEACFRVEEAAYELRVASEDRLFRIPKDQFKHAAARTKLEVATDALFGALAEELTQLVVSANGAPAVELGNEVAPLRNRDGSVDGEGAVSVDPAGGVAIKARTGLGEPRLLLDLVYYFFHFPKTRDPILSSPALTDSVQAISVFNGAPAAKEVVAALATLKDWMTQPSVSAAGVQAPIQVLCKALQLEYCARGAPLCW